MSEMGDSIQVPAEQSFDTEALQGSMQQILQDNIGNYVLVDFLIGTQAIQTQRGLLYAVGTQFIVLYDDINLQYIVCDIFAIKFVTFFLPGYRPGQVPTSNLTYVTPSTASAPAPEETPAMPVAAPLSGVTPAQAAFSHVMKKTRR